MKQVFDWKGPSDPMRPSKEVILGAVRSHWRSHSSPIGVRSHSARPSEISREHLRAWRRAHTRPEQCLTNVCLVFANVSSRPLVAGCSVLAQLAFAWPLLLRSIIVKLLLFLAISRYLLVCLGARIKRWQLVVLIMK